MIDENNLHEEDDFEKLLNDFINSSIEDEKEKAPETKKTRSKQKRSNLDKDDEPQQLEPELADTLADAKVAIEEHENMPELGADESELAQAFLNFKSSINNLSQKFLKIPFACKFTIDDLYPNYKPSMGRLLSQDLVIGWRILCDIFPDEVGKFPVSSTDEEFLNFAETLKNADLQLAVISYVEILIDMESCELSYQAKLIKYQEKHIKKIMYEEYLARKERQRLYTEAVKKRNFPIDAERMITSYFRAAQKDVDGAFTALTTNPAIFAPIDFSKIKPRFFGLIKVSPKDGIKINMQIAKFMKNLKV